MSGAIPRVEPRRGRLKKCAGPCGQWLPVECFGVERRLPDGRRNECRACRAERRAELRAGAERFRPWQRRRGWRAA